MIANGKSARHSGKVSEGLFTLSVLPVAGCRMIDLPVLGDERGSLIAIEPGDLLPFSIGGVSYVFATRPGAGETVRFPARSREWIIAVAGSCTLLVDDGVRRAEVLLDRADKALEVEPKVRREAAHFSADAVVMLLAENTETGERRG